MNPSIELAKEIARWRPLTRFFDALETASFKTLQQIYNMTSEDAQSGQKLEGLLIEFKNSDNYRILTMIHETSYLGAPVEILGQAWTVGYRGPLHLVSGIIDYRLRDKGIFSRSSERIEKLYRDDRLRRLHLDPKTKAIPFFRSYEGEPK